MSSNAWSTSRGDGAVIAIVDTGVDRAHPDLASQLVEGIDLVDGGEVDDPHGHGTHVAGIAAATGGNGIGVSGAAPDAMIMPVRVLDENGVGDDETIAEGIRWAVANGAHVINLSLGDGGVGHRLRKGGAANLAIREATSAGVVVVAAAGNDDSVQRSYRIGVDVLVVNASDEAGRPSSFTNVGDPRAVSAPGVDILSTATTAATTLFDGEHQYATLDDTSMATPLVSGLAALLLATGTPAAEVIDTMVSTASNPSGDPSLGAGIVDARAALGGSCCDQSTQGSNPPRMVCAERTAEGTCDEQRRADLRYHQQGRSDHRLQPDLGVDDRARRGHVGG